MGYGQHRDLEGLPPRKAEEAHHVRTATIFFWLVLMRTVQDEQGECSLSRIR